MTADRTTERTGLWTLDSDGRRRRGIVSIGRRGLVRNVNGASNVGESSRFGSPWNALVGTRRNRLGRLARFSARKLRTTLSELLAKTGSDPTSVAFAAAGAALGLALAGVPGFGVGAVAAAALVRRARRRNELARLQLASLQLPEAVEMMAIASIAGMNPYMCVRSVCDSPPQGCEWVFSKVRSHLLSGMDPAEALSRVAQETGLGELAAAARCIGSSTRHGSPLAPALRKVAEDLRDRRLRTLEAEARRAPVKMLFPIVFCILPAFVLLTVVPVLVDTFAIVRS